jgi:hypothetical protein
LPDWKKAQIWCEKHQQMSCGQYQPDQSGCREAQCKHPNSVNINEQLGLGATNYQGIAHQLINFFDRLAEKFVDYLDASAKTLTEEEKVARLRWALFDTLRQLFKPLIADEQSTLEKATEALPNKFNSPQRRELCKRQWAVRANNGIMKASDFLKGLGPLVKIVYSSMDEISLKKNL